MSARKSSHRTIFLIVSSGSPLALIASSLRSTSKKPVCPMTRSFHPPMAIAISESDSQRLGEKNFSRCPKLFLPCSGMHSPIRANRYPLTTITGAQRASGQTHSRARSHQGDADLRADRSTAYLVSYIRVRSAHGNSFNHIIAAREQSRRNLSSY